MKRSILKDKSKAFALRIIKMAEYVQASKKEYVLSKQVLRSGTSIGANVHEAFFGQSLPDFIAKLSIARKECGETQYWLDLLCSSDKITAAEYESINADCEELGKLLTASVNTSIAKLKAGNQAQQSARSKEAEGAALVCEPLPPYGASPLTNYSL